MSLKISEKANQIGEGFIEYFESKRSEYYRLSERDRFLIKQALEYSLLPVKPLPKERNLDD